MASHREVWRLLQRGLTGEAVAKIVINEVERLEQGKPPLWTDAEIERLKQPLVHDAKARHAYARVINRWCEAHDVDASLEEIDPPSEITLEGLVRSHVIDRHMAWKRPQLDALESYVEPGGWTNWRQHAWEPSGILPVPQDPEAAWLDFVAWCRDGMYQSAEPLMSKQTYLRIFSQNKPFHPWQLRAPEDPAQRPT